MKILEWVQNLDKQLLDWAETLPTDWHPTIQPIGLESTTQMENYISLKVAELYNNWRCARLIGLQLRYIYISR